MAAFVAGSVEAPVVGAFATIVLFLFLAIVGAGCSPARTLEAARLLADVARVDMADPVGRSEIAYAGRDKMRSAHLYRPVRVRAALVLVPGATEAGMEDPRLIDFAAALRGRGFLVLVPALAGDDPLRVSAADSEPIADAVRYLTGPAGFGEVGLAALSYAVGPTVLAALEEDVRERVGFVVAIGGYHQILGAITYLTTGAFRLDPAAVWRWGRVDRRAKWIFLKANASRIGNPADARLLETIATRRLAHPAARTTASVAGLGPEGRAVYRLFVNRDPDQVPKLLEALPPELLREIRALDLASRDLNRLAADLVLIHGRGDPLVPYTESMALARAAGEDRSSLHLIDGLDHVDLRALGAADMATLLRAAYRVLLERDAVPPPPSAGPSGA